MLSPRNSPPNNTPRPSGTKATGLPSPSITHSPSPIFPRQLHTPVLAQGSPVPRLLHQTQTLPTCSLRPSHPWLPRSPGSPKTIQQQPRRACPVPGSRVLCPGKHLSCPHELQDTKAPGAASGSQPQGPRIAQHQCPRCACLSAGLPAWKRGGSPHGTAVLVSHVPSRLSSPHQSTQSTARTPVPPSHPPTSGPGQPLRPGPGLSFPQLETRLLTPSPPCCKP